MSGSRRRPGTGISSTWSGCSCSSASIGGARPAPPSSERRRHRSFQGGGRPPPWRFWGKPGRGDRPSQWPRAAWAAPVFSLQITGERWPDTMTYQALRGRLRPLLGLTLAALFGLLVLLGLGTWQLERRVWKLDLIAAREAGLAAAPIELPERLAAPAGLDYRPVLGEGRFRHESELDLIGRFSGDQPGYQIMTPLILADGSAVLVNRGFVPLAAKD